MRIVVVSCFYILALSIHSPRLLEPLLFTIEHFNHNKTGETQKKCCGWAGTYPRWLWERHSGLGGTSIVGAKTNNQLHSRQGNLVFKESNKLPYDGTKCAPFHDKILFSEFNAFVIVNVSIFTLCGLVCWRTETPQFYSFYANSIPVFSFSFVVLYWLKARTMDINIVQQYIVEIRVRTT